MVFNYLIGSSLTNKKEQTKTLKKQLLAIGVIGNVGLLAYFKYSDFFISNINLLLNLEKPLLNLALPLAISFFTFQQIAYLVDSYRNETNEYDFLNYAVFVTFFPQLIAGPIVHHKEMMPQFAKITNKDVDYKNISLGLFIFSIGLFKKLVLADSFAIWATNGFDNTETLTFIEAWVTSLSYSFQLYFDFSGYTDMAIGSALLFNIKLPINFNSPYKAKNIQEFWRRWHITLSRFMRDYIYIPFGGNKKGNFRTYINLITTFLIGGLWHGAGWTFIFWGGLHGLALVIQRIWNKVGFRLNIIISWIITFNFVNVTWVFFRANEWDDAIKVLEGMAGFNGFKFPNIVSNEFVLLSSSVLEFDVFLQNIGGNQTTLIWLLFGFISTILFSNSMELKTNFKNNLFYYLFTLILTIVSIAQLNEFTEFLYFNF